MKTYRLASALRIAAGMLLLPLTLHSATAPEATHPPRGPGSGEDTGTAGDDIIVLSVFEVSTTAQSRYQMHESTSGGRVRVHVMDTPASVDVITSDFIADIGAQRMIEAAKYSAGLIEGNLPSSLDRLMIRGFQSQGQYVDGFFFAGQSNLEPAIVDRLEIIKGPNSVLSPTGNPGGTINAISKKAHLLNIDRRVGVQVDTFGQRKGFLDINETVGDDGNVAYRLVLTGQDSDSYADNLVTKNFVFAPSVTARFGRSQLTILGDIARTSSVAFVGLPVDPSSGTANKAKLLHGVPRTLGLAEEDEKRHEDRDGFSAFFTSSIGDHLSVRLAGRWVSYYFDTLQYNTGYPAGSGGGGSINPHTGFFEPGVTWSGNITNGFTSRPTPPDTRIVTRSGSLETNHNQRRDVQNDYVWDADIGPAHSVTTAGFSYSSFYQRRTNLPSTRGSYVIDSPQRGIEKQFADVINQHQVTDNSDVQFYIQQNLALFDNRLTLSGGWTDYSQDASTTNRLTDRKVEATQSANTRNYGLVAKPWPNVSLYYGHSESAVPSQVTSSTVLPVSQGEQDEFGLKVQAMDGKIMLSVAHFDIAQSNQAQPNPANLAVPPPSPLLPSILVDRENRGWEFSLNATITRSLHLVGNFTTMHNRDPRGVMVRSSADRSAALLARYEIRNGTFEGLSFSAGFEYLGRRAGDNSSGYTAASTPDNLIPVQPSFFLPSYTLLNFGVGYQTGAWNVQLNVNNATDKHYIISSLTRSWVWAGPERNAQLSVTRKF